MIFFVEGPDGAGKTTLLRNIRDDKRMQSYFLASSSQPSSWDEIQQELDWINAFPADATLFVDRHRVVSEGIYGRVLRGGTLFPKDKPARDITGQNIRFIYCRPPAHVIETNVKTSKQLSGVERNLDTIIGAYDAIFGAMGRKHPGWVLEYDYTSDRVPGFLNRVFAIARKLNG